MPVYNNRNKGYIIAIIAVLLVVRIGYHFWRKPAAGKNTLPAPSATVPPATDTLPVARATRLLPDSTHVYLMENAMIVPHKDYPLHREITLDGDAFFNVPAIASPLIIHSKLFTLTVMGNAKFRFIAPSVAEWAEVDVINGTVIVRKAYSSSFNAPDTLHNSQMEMINRTIDLMEKEEFDARALSGWSDRLPR